MDWPRTQQASATARRSTRMVLTIAILLGFGARLVSAEPVTFGSPVRVFVDDVAVSVELADSPARRSRGLQGRTSLSEDHGMLFVFSSPGILRFWMKDTLIDLDIGFFDTQGRLLNTATMMALNEIEFHRSVGPAQFALEVPAGWFDRHGVGPGARLGLPASLLQSTRNRSVVRR